MTVRAGMTCSWERCGRKSIDHAILVPHFKPNTIVWLSKNVKSLNKGNI